jgi:hypothetical protein
MTPALRQAVRERAGGRCEYCRLLERFAEPFPFHAEHIVARQHRGSDDPSNLAWSCHRCNRLKGPNPASFDPDTNALERLFNPRTDRWGMHFRVEGSHIIGMTAVGRTTVFLLELNSPERLVLRELMIRSGNW